MPEAAAARETLPSCCSRTRATYDRVPTGTGTVVHLTRTQAKNGGGAGYCPRYVIVENTRRDGPLAGNPRRSRAEAVPAHSAVWSRVPVRSAESRQRNGNTR